VVRRDEASMKERFHWFVGFGGSRGLRFPGLLLLPALLVVAGADVGLKAGAVRRDGAGIEQVWVPPGSFRMGTSDVADLDPPAWARRELASEQPAHLVTLSSGFWIDRHEVTNAAFAAFVADAGYQTRALWSHEGWQWLQEAVAAGRDLPQECREPLPDHPRVCITWYEASAYADWRGGRLPTEAEWEYAARGPTSRVFPWGDDFDSSRANVLDSRGTTAVGSIPQGASWVGALDMSGNAMEWVQDWLDPGYYALAESPDPTGPASGRIKVEKGGWWGGPAYAARSAYRHFEDPPEYSDHHIGFRIVTPDGAPGARP
jgi:formylglycine-generating enzyme required for sulfatase activity